MAKATVFYLPNFKTKYPNGKIFTRNNADGSLIYTYKSADGTLNTNPILLDNKGEATIYLDSDLVYVYQIYDENDVFVGEYVINQLKGEPGLPGGPKGPDGDQGIDGDQGDTGDTGEDGEKGDRGDKGYPYLSKTIFKNDGEITIPQGIEAIYITGCGGGGSAAKHSNYFYTIVAQEKDFVDSSSYARTKIDFFCDDGLTYTSTNYLQYKTPRYEVLQLIPGSGFAGESVFREKISLDKNKKNSIFIKIGTGGISPINGLNGNNGTDTEIYVNNQLVRTLKGGKGGENKAPTSKLERDKKIKEMRNNVYNFIRVNNGYTSGFACFKSTTALGASGFQNDSYWIADTYFTNPLGAPEKKTGLMQFKSFVFQSRLSLLTNEGALLTINSEMAYGQKNIFNPYYNLRPQTSHTYMTTLASYINKETEISACSYGRGGDYFINIRNSSSNPAGWKTNEGQYTTDSSTSDSPYLRYLNYSFDIKQYINFINYEISFAKSAEPGAYFKEYDYDAANAPYISYCDNLAVNPKTKAIGYVQNTSIDLVDDFIINRHVDSAPSSGSDGICIIEYGDIEDIK